MAAEIKEENLSLALRFIVEKFGKDALLNQDKVKAILPDLLSNKFTTETSWVMDAINSGIVGILLNPNNTNEEAIEKAKDVFEKHYVTEIRQEYVLDCLSYALGWTNTKVDSLDEYKAKVNKKNSKPKFNLEKEIVFKDSIDDNNKHNEQKEPDYDEILNQQKEEYRQEPINTNRQFDNTNLNNRNNQNNYNDSNGNKKKLLLLIPLLLIIIGLGVTKLFSGPGDVEVSDFYFSPQTKLNGTTYMIDKNETVQLNITLDAKNKDKIDKDKISYSLDDNTVCNYKKETYNKCILVGVGEGTTTLRIYYNDKEIQAINIGVGDVDSNDSDDVAVESIYPSSNAQKSGSGYVLPVGEEAQLKVKLSGDDVENDELSYSLDDSSIAELSYDGDKCILYGNQAGSTNLRIMYDGDEIYSVGVTFEEGSDTSSNNDSNSNSDSNSEVDLVVKGYLGNYADALNYGSIGYVSDYLTSSGDLYKQLSKTIPKTYEKGTQVDVVGYTKNSMKKEGNKYRVSATIEYNIYKQDKGAQYQKEYMEFIVVQSSGQWLIDHYDNWQMLEQHNI
ncbi:TcaA NTF2-like domain-containing protein [Intestinibacter bartlettii]|uniref:TcaA NTF2-like domain-containing protein n=1 Tax=Intestinibacter bartlettii TaxID=261299 RepID=UPI00319DD3B3